MEFEEAIGQPVPQKSMDELVERCDDAWEHLDAISKAVQLKLTAEQAVKIILALTALRLAYEQVCGASTGKTSVAPSGLEG